MKNVVTMENHHGTAGSPMLTLLKANHLCNVIVIVTRYFGGILLGTGGLVRAYSDATSKVLLNAKYLEMEKGKEIKVTLSYPETQNFKYYCRKNNIKIVKEEYSDNVEIFIEISDKIFHKLQNDTDNLYLKMTKIDIINEKHVKTNTVI